MTNGGRELEKRVYELLRNSGRQKLSQEILIGSKKCDLFFETMDHGFKYRTAVECKDYSKPLTKTDVNSIILEYLDLLNLHVDRVLIVTRNGLSAAANKKIFDLPNFSHTTVYDLEQDILNLRPYVEWQKFEFEEENYRDIYVPCIGEAENGLHIDNIEDYLEGQLKQANQPLALIGGYGVGKTTTVKELYIKLANNFLNDHSNPIPIYVKLSRLNHEQTVEGLFGSMFSAEFPSKGYSYPILKYFNKIGRLVLLLDGFDEMRHKLSWAEFDSILENLRDFTAENHKIIFAGRPTAFLNQMEYDAVIKGKAGQTKPLSSTENPIEFKEINIFGFNQSRVFEFTTKLANSNIDLEFDHHRNEKFFQTYHKNKPLQDLAKRPVQLLMICRVLPLIEANSSEINSATVYDLFIDDLIRRDQKKISRKAFSASQRRSFARSLAFWLWIEKSQSTISSDQIPDSLITPFLTVSDTLDEVRRDLIVGSFLSSKKGKQIYFPHRSIQEYMIAEHFIELISSEADYAVDFIDSTSCNEEILRFCREMILGVCEKTLKNSQNDKKRRMRDRQTKFGEESEVPRLIPLYKNLAEKDGLVNLKLIKLATPHHLSASSLYNIGRRFGSHFHLISAIYWIGFEEKDLDRKKNIARELLDDIKNRITGSNETKDAFYFFLVCFISAVMDDIKLVIEPLQRVRIPSAKIVYETKSKSINFSSIYKPAAKEARNLVMVKEWLINDGFNIEGYKLPTKIYDPFREVWNRLN